MSLAGRIEALPGTASQPRSVPSAKVIAGIPSSSQPAPAAAPAAAAPSDLLPRDSSITVLADDQAAVARVPSSDGNRDPERAAAERSTAGPAAAPGPQINLTVCPSFAEQSGKKVVWLERHSTLRYAHQESLGMAPSCDAPDAAASEPTPAPSSSASAAARGAPRFLPSWDICKSDVWRMAEAALRGTPPAAANGGRAPAPSANGHPHPHVDVAASRSSDAAASNGGQPQPPSPMSLTPFAVAHVQSSLQQLSVMPPQPPPSPSQPSQQPTQPRTSSMPTQGSISAGSTIPRPAAAAPAAAAAASSAAAAAAPMLRRARSTAPGRACPGVPRGMGPLPLTLTPSLALESLRSSQSVHMHQQHLRNHHSHHHTHGHSHANGPHAEGGAAAATAAGSPRAAASPKPRPQTHVAFAAGVAAATSLNAAAQSATGALVSAIATAASVAHATSTVLELGQHALGAGTDMCINKLQGFVVKQAAGVVADTVLGPAASASLRADLRRRVRATVAGVSVAWALLHVAAMGDTLTHVDLHTNFLDGAKLMLDLATSGPGLLENVREIAQLGLCVSVGMGQRHVAAGGGGGDGGDLDDADLDAQLEEAYADRD